MIRKILFYILILLPLLFTFLYLIDSNWAVSALSFNHINISALEIDTNTYNDAVIIVKNSQIITYIRSYENILLENEIYNIFSSTDEYQLILKKRVLFMAEYIKAHERYYNYITTDIYAQPGLPIEKAKLINELMNGFYSNWKNEYNIFLKKILLKELY